MQAVAALAVQPFAWTPRKRAMAARHRLRLAGVALERALKRLDDNGDMATVNAWLVEQMAKEAQRALHGRLSVIPPDLDAALGEGRR